MPAAAAGPQARDIERVVGLKAQSRLGLEPSQEGSGSSTRLEERATIYRVSHGLSLIQELLGWEDSILSSFEQRGKRGEGVVGRKREVSDS
jgi:hypothetical protein